MVQQSLHILREVCLMLDKLSEWSIKALLVIGILVWIAIIGGLLFELIT